MSYIVPKEIPKHCFACPCGYETEGAFRNECQVLAREWEKDADSVRPNWCPLVEFKGWLEGGKVIQMLDEIREKLTKDMHSTEARLVFATIRVIKFQIGRMMWGIGNDSTLIEEEGR